MKATETPCTTMEPNTDCHSLRNDSFEAVFAPHLGGRMLSLRHVDHGDLLVPLLDTSFDPDRWPKAGAFPLFPFHNRLRNAAFRHEGRVIRLRPNAANGVDVMHGPAHRRPWTLTRKGSRTLEMTLAYHADDDWPFDFTATQHFELCGNTLSVSLSLANTGPAAMPGGIGWHPYFKPCRDGQIRIDAGTNWDLTKSDDLSPSSPSSGPIALDVTQHYSAWTKAVARIGNDATISLSGDASLSCLAALRKTGYLCLEPASHVAAALEPLSVSAAEIGMRLLAPGETLSGTATLCVT